MSLQGSITATVIREAIEQRLTEVLNQDHTVLDEKQYAWWRGEVSGLRQAIEITRKWEE